MSEKSMLDVTFELLNARQQAVSFNEIWAAVQKQVSDAKPERVSRFYTNLSLDGRFVALGGKMWDLRTRYTYKQLHEEVRGVFKDVEEVEEVEEEKPEGEEAETVDKDEEGAETETPDGEEAETVDKDEEGA